MDFNTSVSQSPLGIVASFYLVTGGAISALVLLVGHYFPWHKLLGEELSRLWSYRYGSGACWVGFAYWRYFGLGDYASPIGLMFIYTIAGTVVWLAYRIDAKGQTLTIANRRRKTDELPIVKEKNQLNDQRH